jgi:hypothetical protein
MFRKVSIWCGIVLIVLATGCNRQEPVTSKKEAPAPPAPATAAAPVPAAAPAAQPVVKKGTVAETMDAGGYTYILVDDGKDKTWVATLQSKVNTGQEVAYYDGMVMENFVSKSLNRTFDKIVFSSGLAGQETAATAPATAGQTASSESFDQALRSEQGMGGPATIGSGSRKAVVPFAEIHVDKATGDNSYTVGELYEKAKELDGKTVKVRGKIVKISSNIMGRNWIHIQDGSGSPGESTHDLVVTTTAAPDDSWDVITASGVISANKDFGAGYTYRVILEEAAISK